MLGGPITQAETLIVYEANNLQWNNFHPVLGEMERQQPLLQHPLHLSHQPCNEATQFAYLKLKIVQIVAACLFHKWRCRTSISSSEVCIKKPKEGKRQEKSRKKQLMVGKSPLQ